jgi:hypothetical protein
MCCDLFELLTCGHDGKPFGWEVCNIQNLMQGERRKGTLEDTQIMKEYEYICSRSPLERRAVTTTGEICYYCRLYAAGERATNEERRGLAL